MSVVKMCDKDVVVNGNVVTEAEPLRLKRNIGLVSGVAYIAGMIIGDDVMSSLHPFSLTSRALTQIRFVPFIYLYNHT